GGDIVAIKIVQGALTSSEPAAPRRKKRPLTTAERQALEARTAGIQDSSLRAAIVALGAAVLTADDSDNSTPDPRPAT
ncbi:MAG: hypothetical protein KJ871_02905, partial [Alphaproteobacteria bacterium]|nr:hypothetical protein [Alphaproteobacteria bacterium]